MGAMALGPHHHMWASSDGPLNIKNPGLGARALWTDHHMCASIFTLALTVPFYALNVPLIQANSGRPVVHTQSLWAPCQGLATALLGPFWGHFEPSPLPK